MDEDARPDAPDPICRGFIQRPEAENLSLKRPFLKLVKARANGEEGSNKLS